MDEPELPGIPPPPEPQKPSWYKHLWTRLFGWWKWPGWAGFLYLIFTEIPDWRHRIDFWLNAAEMMGGYLGTAAAFIGSSYFRWSLFSGAIVYLVFVGEPQRGVQRHQWLPYIGWAVFGVCITAFVITAGRGAITIYIQEQVNSVDQALQQKAATRPLFWHLTDYNKNTLGFALDQTPKDKRFEVLIQCLPDATSRTYVEDLAQAFLAHQWSVKANCLFSQLKPDFLGVEIAVSARLAGRQLSEIPDNAQTLAQLLTDAQIPFTLGAEELVKEEKDVMLFVGNGPRP
jgi:hypothetical protein